MFRQPRHRAFIDHFKLIYFEIVGMSENNVGFLCVLTSWYQAKLCGLGLASYLHLSRTMDPSLTGSVPISSSTVAFGGSATTRFMKFI